MNGLYNYFRGSFRRKLKNPSRITDMLIKNNIPFSCEKSPDGEYVLTVPMSYRKKYKSLSARLGQDGGSERGFLEYLKKYRLRFGFFIGALIFAFFVAFSSFFVWDIEISGNITVTDGEILAMLDNYGVRYGAYIPNLDTEKIALHALIDDPRLLWIGINIRGTVAHVRVKETDGSVTVEDASPSNLISAYDAQITSLAVTGGGICVRDGDIVKKGQLLVSGIIDSQAVGYRLVHSGGSVYGKINLCFTSEIPYIRQEKRYTGRETVQKSVKFFSKSVKLFGNDSISYEKYDKIESVKRVCLFGRIKLPVWISETVFREYGYEDREITEAEALALAQKDLLRQSSDITARSEIISREIETLAGESSLRLTLTLVCVTDIAEQSHIGTK